MSFTEIPLREQGVEIENFWFNMLRTAGILLESGVLPVTDSTILNNQASPVDLTDASYDGAIYTSVKIDVEIKRIDATPTEVMARIELWLIYKSTGWELTQVDRGDDVGVVFSIDTTGSMGQVQYTSTNMSGGSYSGTVKYFASKFGG